MSTTIVDEEFGTRLRLIMQQFGSVADLARAVGVSAMPSTNGSLDAVNPA